MSPQRFAPKSNTQERKDAVESTLNTVMQKYELNLGQEAVNRVMDGAVREDNSVDLSVRENLVRELRDSNPELAAKIEGEEPQKLEHTREEVRPSPGHTETPSRREEIRPMEGHRATESRREEIAPKSGHQETKHKRKEIKQ